MASSVGNDPFRFVLLGKTGSGKSSTGNTILGFKAFKVSASFSSVTNECALEEADLANGTQVEVVDTPGLCDTRTSDEDTCTIITRTLLGVNPGPHALIYVLKLDRFTKEEYTTFKKLEKLFDKRLYQYLIVVITGGDNLEEAETTFEEVLENAPASLQKLLGKCNNRYVVFNNRSKDSAQVATLLHMMKELVITNGSQPYYSLEKFKALGEKLDKEVKRRMVESEKEHMKKEKAFQDEMAQYEKDMAEKEKEMKEALAKKEMSEKKAKQIQEEYRKRLNDKEMELQRMKAQHREQRQEDHVRKTIKREAMTTHEFWFKSMLTATGAILGLTISYVAAAAVPVLIAASPVVIAAGAVAGTVAAVKVIQNARGGRNQ